MNRPHNAELHKGPLHRNRRTHSRLGGADVEESTLPALVWLEQTKPGVFVKHTIEVGFPRHATLDVGDIDGDGDIDIVTGNFAANRSVPSWVDIWENQSKKPKAATGSTGR